MAAEEVVLAVGASAEPDTCGSCKFFVRREVEYMTGGRCAIKLPPRIATKYELGQLWENSDQFDRMKDTDRCDLQRPDGKVYIVQRRIPPER